MGFRPPFSSCCGWQAALKRSCRGLRVTRDRSAALRVRAAKNDTRKLRLDGPRAGLITPCQWAGLNVREQPVLHHVSAIDEGVAGLATRVKRALVAGFGDAVTDRIAVEVAVNPVGNIAPTQMHIAGPCSSTFLA